MKLVLFTIQAYNTGREHQIACESEDMLRRICESRFGYTRLPQYETDGYGWLEPNWCVRKREVLQ